MVQACDDKLHPVALRSLAVCPVDAKCYLIVKERVELSVVQPKLT